MRWTSAVIHDGGIHHIAEWIIVTVIKDNLLSPCLIRRCHIGAIDGLKAVLSTCDDFFGIALSIHIDLSIVPARFCQYFINILCPRLIALTLLHGINDATLYGGCQIHIHHLSYDKGTVMGIVQQISICPAGFWEFLLKVADSILRR